MTKEQWAFVVSLCAMLLVASSYFFKKKSQYLLLQCSGLSFLMLSYLLTAEYFAMIGIAIALARLATYFLFELKNKKPSIFWPLLYSGLSVAAYVIINLCILKTVKAWDILNLVALIAYTFVFWIRDLRLVRYLITIPTGLTLLYNIGIGAPVFVAISYSFELSADIVSIIKYEFWGKRKHGTKNN